MIKKKGTRLGPDWRNKVPKRAGRPAKKAEALRRLEAGEQVTKVAEDMGIDRVTLWRWMQRKGGWKMVAKEAEEQGEEAKERLADVVGPEEAKRILSLIARSGQSEPMEKKAAIKELGELGAWQEQGGGAELPDPLSPEERGERLRDLIEALDPKEKKDLGI